MRYAYAQIGYALFNVYKLPVQLLVERLQPARIFHGYLALRRKLKPTLAPYEQNGAKLLLKLAYVMAYGRLRERKRLRRFCEVFIFHDRQKGFHFCT